MNTLVLIGMAVMTALGVWIAERHLKGHTYILGLWFGFLAVVANSASVLSVAEFNIALSLRDAPVIAAALFFGPIPGIIAGVIAAIERALTPLWGVGAPTWCPMATFIVSLIAAALGKFFLDGKRPTLAQTSLLGVIFELLHLAFDILMGLSRIARCCEIVFNAFLPETIALTVALMASCLVLKKDSSAAHESTISPGRILATFVFFVAVITGLNAYNAYQETLSRGESALQRLEYVFDSQIDFMLHHDVTWIAEKLGTLKKLNTDEVSGIIAEARYDEMCIVDTAGKVISANDEKFIGFDFSTVDMCRKYLALIHDTKRYIGEPFRPSGLDGVNVKYGGIAFPDASGFIQLGFYRTRLENDFIQFFSPILRGNVQLGTKEYCLVSSLSDSIILAADQAHRTAERQLLSDIGLTETNGFVHLFGEWCHVRSKDVGQCRVFCLIPISETFGPGLIDTSLLTLICFAFIFGFRMVMLRFQRQREKIDRLREEADERNHRDLEMAAKIQSSSLPADFPVDDHFSFFAKMCPAKEVGGDFYDCYRFKDGKIVFTVADVSGKGIPAAMFMIKAKQTLKSAMFHSDDYVDAFKQTNEQLAQQNDAEMFVTLWSGIYDPATGVVDFINAGHNPPLIKHADGTVEWLRKRGGPALGVIPGCNYRTGSITLAPGDSLLLYTDGVTEAQNIDGNFYGEERLANLLSSAQTTIVPTVFDDVATFAGAAEQADDITALALKVDK